MKIPVKIQMTNGENGAVALDMMLGGFGKFVPMAELREVCVTSRNGSSPEQILSAAEKYGLTGEVRSVPLEEIKASQLPLLVQWKKRYYVIIRKMNESMVWLTDPAKGEYRLQKETFAKRYSGKVIFLKKGPDFQPGGHKDSLMELIGGRIKKIVKPVIGLIVFSLLSIWIHMSLSEGIRYFMDNMIAGKEYSGLLLSVFPEMSPEKAAELMAALTIAGLYGLVFLTALFTILKDRISTITSRAMSAESGARMFKKMFGQPLKFFEQHNAGDLMNRFESNQTLDHSLMEEFVPRIINTVMTGFYFFMLLSYNKVIALLCVGIEVINAIIVIRLQERNAIVSRTIATSTGHLNSSVLNGMNMIETIQSTGSERSFFNIWFESQSQCNDSSLTSMKIQRQITLCSNIHNYLIQGIQLFLGAYFISIGKFTIGTLALFQSILGNMRTSLSSALSSINSLQKMRTNIERVNDITERETMPEIPLQEGVDYDKLEGHIQVSHVKYRYNNGDRFAVDDVSLEVKPGQMVAIVGKTGCGKSTLLKVMADLYKAESGEILYSGKRRDEIPDVVFHSSVTTVDQETVIFEDSVYSNIQMWDITVEDYEIYLACRDAQIHQRIMRDHEGYGAKMRENGSNFSGGELQRIELARALAGEPTMLFLDEFTSALDALTEDKVIRSIREKGTTCVIVAHRLSTIVDCDMIYVMDHGKIVQAGTHEELYKQEGLYRELIGSQ